MDFRLITLLSCVAFIDRCMGYCYPKYTAYTDDGRGNLVYLDRQNKISCDRPGFAITSFRLVRHANKKSIQYRIKCCKTDHQEYCQTRVNQFTNDGRGNVVYLDRQQVTCPNNGYLKSFYLNRNGHRDNVRYTYKCCTTRSESFCYGDHTRANADGQGNMVYLDRHEPRCWDGYYMNRFRLVRPTHSTIRYNYSCCRYQ